MSSDKASMRNKWADNNCSSYSDIIHAGRTWNTLCRFRRLFVSLLFYGSIKTAKEEQVSRKLGVLAEYENKISATRESFVFWSAVPGNRVRPLKPAIWQIYTRSSLSRLLFIVHPPPILSNGRRLCIKLSRSWRARVEARRAKSRSTHFRN